MTRRLHPRGRRAAVCVLTISPLLAAVAPRLAGAQTLRRPLTRDTVIDGVSCTTTGKASAEWHRNGRLLECPLARDTVMWGHSLPAGSWIILHDDGTPDGAWLSRDALLNGYTCRGDGYKQWSVRFHRSGTLALCFLRRDTTINGVPCLRGTFFNEVRGGSRTALIVGPDGALRQCQAARPFVLRGMGYRKWDVVRVPPATQQPDASGEPAADR